MKFLLSIVAITLLISCSTTVIYTEKPTAFSGPIINWPGGSNQVVFSIYDHSQNNYVPLAFSQVNSDKSFFIVDPPKSDLDPYLIIAQYSYPVIGLQKCNGNGETASSSTAQFQDGQFFVFNNSTPNGYLVLSTYDFNSTPVVGDSFLELVYSSENFSLAGNFYGCLNNSTVSVQESLKMGWNVRIISVATMAYKTVTSWNIRSGAIPDKANWRYYPSFKKPN